MPSENEQLHWTEEQWNRIIQVVTEEAGKARVASSFLPLVGPLPSDTDYVSKDALDLVDPLHAFPTTANKDGKPEDGTQSKILWVDDISTVPLATLQVRIAMRGAQVADPELASGLQMFRRAANVLARLEDSIIFNGQKATGRGPKYSAGVEPPIWDVLGGEKKRGLVPSKKALNKNDELPRQILHASKKGVEKHGPLGNQLVSRISAAIGELEAHGHLGPFACVLDQGFFDAVQTPNKDSLVLPQDRIIPFLGGGPLLRSSVLEKNSGVVVALGGDPIDLVVATDISVNFLQVTLDPRFVFRIYEKLTLRIKQPKAIAALISE